ncbi:hypothetical protein IW22_11915 [Chryseobacterium sp. JM1]|nr:hypothetical protein IW22_11915 [Chryseobacterium sp. JM1]
MEKRHGARFLKMFAFLSRKKIEDFQQGLVYDFLYYTVLSEIKSLRLKAFELKKILRHGVFPTQKKSLESLY